MYAIDKIEEDIVVAEKLDSNEKVTFKKDSFPFTVYEGLIFSVLDGKIIKEEQIEQNRRKTLREKMEALKKHE